MYYDEKSDVSRGMQIKNEIMNALKKYDKKETVKVARVDMVFDNKKMIELLFKRGQAMKHCQYKQIGEINQEILNLKPQ